MIYSKHLWISKTQNVERLKGKRFVYHLKHYKYHRLTRCGLGRYRVLTYTEAHDAKGSAVCCLNCRDPGPSDGS